MSLHFSSRSWEITHYGGLKLLISFRTAWSMIVIQNRIPIKEEYKAQFEKVFSETESHLKETPGFVRNEVLRPVKGNEYIVMTHWETMEDFQNWMNSDAFKKAHTGNELPKEAFDGENQIAMHEVFLSQ